MRGGTDRRLLPKFAARQVQKDVVEVGGLEFEILDPNSRASQSLHPSGEFVSEIFASSDDSAAGVVDRQARWKFPDGSFGLDFE